MILCLDAGNSRLKWGLRDGAAWRAQGACAHDAIDTLVLPARPARLFACNVAGPAVAERIEALAARLGAPLDWFASRAACCGVKNGYDRPEQLGADRFAALVGAHALQRGAALVVMAGTATTIDVLEADGSFRGGLILPGVELMRRALARATAGLPEARGAFSPLPTNTDDAIESGILQATLGAIERMRAQGGRPASADFPEPGTATQEVRPSAQADLPVLLSGGAAPVLLPHLAPPVRHYDHLVLEGLACVAATAAFS